jgi:hypothetical protein
VQEIQIQRKYKVSPNINGKEVQQETGGEERNDRSSSRYKGERNETGSERKERMK